MRVWTLALCALALVSQNALARELSVATVTPQVACLFTPACAVNATDTIGYFSLYGNAGNAKLLTRTYPGMPGAPAAGLTGYSFRIDMHAAMALGTPNCVETLVLDAGPLVPLKYAPNKMADMFMVGAPTGSAIATANQSGAKITIRFARAICPGRGDSFYFGFAAKGAPVPSRAQLTGSLEGTAPVDVRLPKH